MATTSTAPTAKRSRANTRARLLAASYDVFYERGFPATTVEHICTRAGFTRGAFYSNFSSTDDLFFELWDEQARRLVDAARALVEILGTIRRPLDVAVDALIDLELTEPRWFVLNTEFFLHAMRHPALARKLTRYRVRLRRELGVVLSLLLEREGRELPPTIDLDLFTRLIIAAHEGSQHQSLLRGHELEPGALQRAMLSLLVTSCPKVNQPNVL